MNKETQKRKIIGHLRKCPLSRRDGMIMYGIGNVPVRIQELRDDGHEIETKMVKRGKTRYGVYVLNGGK